MSSSSDSDVLAPLRMLANVRHGLFGIEAQPVRIGPYDIVRRLGAGAMGTVFEAFDSRLRRRLALKIVASRLVDDRRRTQMLSEARSLARLGHPNVVAIFDAGTDDIGVWVAMELLRGRDLLAWLRARDAPAVHETLAALRQAGEGLVAVHDAGMVHRDLKPANVFCTNQARVCLIDFGLAIESGDSSWCRGTETTDDWPVRPIAGTTTLGRTVAGTPAYMAPEQHRGDELTPASDQYAFCVMLWEALYGTRPFTSITTAGLYRRKLARALPATPLRTDVSPGVHLALLRGLASDPNERWSSMRALLAELSVRSTPRRPTRAVALACGTLAAVATLASSASTPAPVCVDVQPSAVWGHDDRAAVRDAITGDGAARRSETAGRVESRLDEHVSAFAEAHAQICSAARTGTVTPAVTEERYSCLSRWRAEFDALVETLRTGATPVVTNAVGWIAGMDPAAKCAELDATDVARSRRPPLALAEDVAALRAELVRAKSERRRGQLDPALQTAHSVLRDAIALDFGPLVAEAEVELGRLHWLRGEWTEVESFFSSGYFHAHAEHHTAVEVDAAMAMVDFLVGNLGRVHDGSVWLERARSVGTGRSAETDVQLLALQSVVDRYSDDAHAAAGHALEALALARSLGADHPAHLASLTNATVMLYVVDRNEEARQLAREDVAARARVFGADHVSLGLSYANLGMTSWQSGDLIAAHEAFARGLEIERSNAGPRSFNVGATLDEIGRHLRKEGQFELATLRLDEAASILEETVGVDHPMFIECTLERGEAALSAGRLAAAAAFFERGRV
ncbi:MAG: serine/threonine protein kinase, partial [Deltaproteobacteria bacterium]|nr:serine/threonine protein kinase [Nannocystaceae bacterium]